MLAAYAQLTFSTYFFQDCGQKTSCNEFVTLDWALGVIMGYNHLSYWNVLDRLKSLRSQKLALNDTSVNEPPPGIYCWLTF